MHKRKEKQNKRASREAEPFLEQRWKSEDQNEYVKLYRTSLLYYDFFFCLVKLFFIIIIIFNFFSLRNIYIFYTKRIKS